jgi:hypothetical protein
MVKFLEDNVDILIGGKDNKMTVAIVYSVLMIALSFGTVELLISQEGNKMDKWRGSLLIRLLYNVIVTLFHHHVHELDKNVSTATLVTTFFSVYMRYGLFNPNIWFIYFTVGNIWIWQIMDNLEDKELKINLLKEIEIE